jgi:inosine-uridine nucleoside N-ribohydrolase
MDIIFDMETQDPDDVFALCFLGSHPKVSLRAVTVTPGSKAQIGLIRYLLECLELPDIPVGARNPDTEKEAVSAFHYKFLGSVPPAEPDEIAHQLLADTFTTYPDAVLLTGAPLQNLGVLLEKHPSVIIRRWVGQGGFAGDNVVPAANRLPKFEGRITCPTFNFNGSPKAAQAMLTSLQVQQRDLVSKNVCHGVICDRTFHQRLQPFQNTTPGLRLIFEGMELYLQINPMGKMFHDPLAACIAVNREIASFREVELYRERGEWGSRLAVGTQSFITVSVDKELFFQTLVTHE